MLLIFRWHEERYEGEPEMMEEKEERADARAENKNPMRRWGHR